MKKLLFLIALITCGSQTYAASEPISPVNKMCQWPNIPLTMGPLHYNFSALRALTAIQDIPDKNLNTIDEIAYIEAVKKLYQQTQTLTEPGMIGQALSIVLTNKIKNIAIDVICDSLAPIIDENVDYYAADYHPLVKSGIKFGTKAFTRTLTYNAAIKMIRGEEAHGIHCPPLFSFSFDIEL